MAEIFLILHDMKELGFHYESIGRRTIVHIN